MIFRIWDKQEQKWANVAAILLLRWKGEGEGIYLTQKDINERFVFQFFTGYRTIDQKRIFEGDIIKEFGPIEFRNGGFGFYLDKKRWFHLDEVSWEDLIVVGNIFEMTVQK